MPDSSPPPPAKQGSYGKVLTHKNSLLEQLRYPREVLAALKVKLGKGLGALPLSRGVESFCKTGEKVGLERGGGAVAHMTRSRAG